MTARLEALPEGLNEGFDAPISREGELFERGARSALLTAYEWPRYWYDRMGPSKHVRNLGAILWYSIKVYGRMQRPGKKVISVNVEDMVKKWHKAVVGLAVAHDKDEADRHESTIEECLAPLLTAPIAQLRKFAPALLESLRADPAVPFIVWRSYEIWLDQIFDKAADEGIVELKAELATEIAKLVETDAKEQLPEAIIRALQWRSAGKLQEVKEVIAIEKEQGRKVRLRGRESCLFLEAGGTESQPKVCVQI